MDVWTMEHVLWVLLGLFLLESMSIATHETGFNLQCINDYESKMLCVFRASAESRCSQYDLHTKVNISYRSTESSCNFTQNIILTDTCSCSLDIDSFVPGEIHNTTLQRDGVLVESENIPVFDNIKPKAPTLISVERDSENGNYVVKWNTNYEKKPPNMEATVTYHRRGEKGTEANVSSTSYPIVGKFLEPSTEYLVNVRSYVTFYSESSEDLSFTTPISPSFIAVLVVLSVCVAAVITTSSLFLLSARYKEKWWDSVGKYKDSTLLVMVPGEHKVLKPQNTALCSVYVDPRKVDRDDNEKPWDSSSSGHSSQSAGVDSRSSSQNVSVDLISSVEDAMRRAFPQIGLPPAEAPWQCAALCNRCYDPVFWTADQPSFENRMYCVAPPPPGIQGRSSVESFYSPSVLRAGLHDPGPDSQFLVPIFQLTTQRQLDSSCMNTVFSYRPWNADSGSPSPTHVLPVDVLPVDLAYSSFPRDANWSSDSSGVDSSVSGVSSIGEPGSEGESLPAAPGPSGVVAEHVYGEERKEQSVNAFLALDNDYQDFRSAASRPGVLIQEASGRRTRDGWLDELSETLFTGTYQRAADAARLSTVVTVPAASQGPRGLLEPRADQVSVLPAEQHKLMVICDYHSVGDVWSQ
ncbi:hypothetical protein NHX12_006040 [Muraenolepis orangiensis]|uniref:Fibronectin type-III domain-containing protein n=1 Tax=Muraenolepis orangiensis TaxID=630683 RepID=A0A9Q0DSK0_9TELE|nr:hypothetical protein NHX12_006040 [Muraenolepis orangiensis]